MEYLLWHICLTQIALYVLLFLLSQLLLSFREECRRCAHWHYEETILKKRLRLSALPNIHQIEKARRDDDAVRASQLFRVVRDSLREYSIERAAVKDVFDRRFEQHRLLIILKNRRETALTPLSLLGSTTVALHLLNVILAGLYLLFLLFELFLVFQVAHLVDVTEVVCEFCHRLWFESLLWFDTVSNDFWVIRVGLRRITI